MYELLKMLHVVGWAGWFGLALGEAVVGAQVRRTDGDRKGLARAWARLGRLQVILMAVGVTFGLGVLGYSASVMPGGMGAYMKDHSNLYVHVMLLFGLVAAAMTVLAAQARAAAVAAIEAGADFLPGYKRAAMFSGISSMLMLLTIIEVMLRTAFAVGVPVG
jgi:hypothetical protein